MEYRVLLLKYNPFVAKAQEQLTVSLPFLLVVRNATTGLGQGVDTQAPSNVTLVDDYGERSRAHKVIHSFLCYYLRTV